jgi:hypothetical protein
MEKSSVRHGEIQNSSGEITAFAFHLKKNGYRGSTIGGTVRTLKAMVNNGNPLERQLVKGYLAEAKCSINSEWKICEYSDRFYKQKGN